MERPEREREKGKERDRETKERERERGSRAGGLCALGTKAHKLCSFH